MIVHEPGPPLEDFISAIWLAQGYVPGPHQQERILPAGDCTLIVNLAGDYAPVVSGPHSRFFVIDTTEQFSVAGVVFRTGRAFPFFDVPLCKLANDHVSLDDLWGGVADELHGLVLEAATPQRKLAVFERVLADRLARAPGGHPAVAYAVEAFQREPSAVTIADVTSRIGVSHRHFLDLFSSQVGLTPKVFCRILRFQRALQHVDAAGPVDWADVAVACGYYDQAHFIHDFRAFSGITPTAYERQRVSQRHVAILD